MMDPIQTKSPRWKRNSLPADNTVRTVPPDSSRKGHWPRGQKAANFKLEEGNSEQTTKPPKPTKRNPLRQSSGASESKKLSEVREMGGHAGSQQGKQRGGALKGQNSTSQLVVATLLPVPTGGE